MSRAITLTRKEAERLGIIGEKGKRRPRPLRLPKRTLREDEIVAFWYRRPCADGTPGPWTLSLTIPTPPRPKKNNTRVTWVRGKPVQLQRKSYYQFVDDVRAVILPRRRELHLPLAPGRYHINAHFYCDNDRSDEKNLEQGLADALERAGVMANDQNLESWDGSRRHVDKARPRVEITIAPLDA